MYCRVMDRCEDYFRGGMCDVGSEFRCNVGDEVVVLVTFRCCDVDDETYFSQSSDDVSDEVGNSR